MRGSLRVSVRCTGARDGRNDGIVGPREVRHETHQEGRPGVLARAPGAPEGGDPEGDRGGARPDCALRLRDLQACRRAHRSPLTRLSSQCPLQACSRGHQSMLAWTLCLQMLRSPGAPLEELAPLLPPTMPPLICQPSLLLLCVPVTAAQSLLQRAEMKRRRVRAGRGGRRWWPAPP